MDIEKGSGRLNETGVSPENGSIDQLDKQVPSDAAFAEAVDIYGDSTTATELGYVQRGYVNFDLDQHHLVFNNMTFSDHNTDSRPAMYSSSPSAVPLAQDSSSASAQPLQSPVPYQFFSASPSPV
jgi:hypothetical protein